MTAIVNPPGATRRPRSSCFGPLVRLSWKTSIALGIFALLAIVLFIVFVPAARSASDSAVATAG